MKMTMEIDLDWIEEDGSIDDVVKKQIAVSVAEKIKEEATEDLLKQAEGYVTERIDAFVTDILNRFMNHEVRVTDRYGDTKARFDNVEEMLKERFDNFLTESVDENGRTTDRCNYRDSTTRVDYLIDARIKKQTEAFVNTVSREVDNKIKAALTAEVKKQLSDNLLSKIDIKALQPAG